MDEGRIQVTDLWAASGEVAVIPRLNDLTAKGRHTYQRPKINLPAVLMPKVMHDSQDSRS